MDVEVFQTEQHVQRPEPQVVTQKMRDARGEGPSHQVPPQQAMSAFPLQFTCLNPTTAPANLPAGPGKQLSFFP